MEISESVRLYGRRGKGLSSPEHIIIKSVKALHLLFATCWAGGALSMQALSFLKLSTQDPVIQEHTQFALYFIDTWVVLPGLLGSFFSGLFYSLCTSIGFFRFFWIGFKWCMVLAILFWGLFFWSGLGDACIANTSYPFVAGFLRFVRSFIIPESMWQGALQLGVILCMCLISVFRPVRIPFFRRKQ